MMSRALAALACLGALAPAQGRPFQAVLWVDRASERSDAFWGAVRGAGFTAVSVTTGDDPAVPGRFGLGFYRDQLAGKGILELRPTQWEPVLERFLATRDPRGLVRPTCLADPATRDALVAAVDRALDAALPHGPWAASLADEASATRGANPLDLCASEAFRSAFRAWVAARSGGDVALLDERWGVGLTSIEQVEPWTTDQIRARELQGPSLPRNLAPWSDQLEFTDGLYAAAVRAALAAVAARAPSLPCGLTGIQPPSAFGGHDYARLLPAMTFYEAYDIGGARDLADALAPPGATAVATLFPLHDGDPPSIIDARLGAMVAHGMSGVVVWSASDAYDGAGEPNAYAERITRVLRRLRPAADAFAGARVLRAPVWIVESQPSVRVHWMLDSWDDGATWPKRFSSWEAAHGTSLHARKSWIAILTDLGVQPDFVVAADLPRRLRATPPRLLVLPATLALSDPEIAAIRDYVVGGGHAIADHGLALYDDALRLRASRDLDDLFGLVGRGALRRDQLVCNARGDDGARLPSGVAIGERGVRGTIGEAVSDAVGMVQIEARPGQGRTTFLNLAVCEYAAFRLAPEHVGAARELRRRVQVALDAAGIAPPVQVRGDGLPTCVERIPLIARDGRRLLAVRLDADDSPELIRVLAARGRRPVELAFAEAVVVRDLVAQRDLSAVEDPGPGSRFTAELGPDEPLLLEVRRP